jgi:hypothetical protein
MNDYVVEFADGSEYTVPGINEEDAAIQAERWAWETAQDMGPVVSVRLA